MSNSDYLATAFVEIRPKTTGFQKELREQLKRAIDPIKNTTVLVSPSTVGFAGKLRTQVRDAITKSGPHRVPVVPTLGSFRKQLAKELNVKPIPVTVTTVGKGGGGGVSGAEKAERQLTQSQIARERVTEALRESERLLKLSTQEGLPLKERDALVTQSQTLAREALTRVTEGQLAGERALVEARLKARAIRDEEQSTKAATEVQNEKDRLKEEADAASAASTKEKLLATTKENLSKVSDRLVLSMDRFHAALRSGAEPARKLSAVERELGVIEKERIALQEQLQGALRRGEKEQAALIKSTVNQAVQMENLIKVEKATLETRKVAQNLGDAEAKIATKLADATKIEISSLTTLKAVREQENVLQRQSTSLDRLEESAQRSNSAATLAFVEAKRTEIATRGQALADQRDFIKNTQKEVTNQKNVGRGLIATSLSFLGLRGATLAAGGAFLAGAAAASTFAKAIQTTAEFETQLNVFQATASATAEEMQLVSETAKQLGADITLPAVSAGSAATAMTELAKAGLEVQDSVDGARGVLQLATAAQIDQAEATQLVASALNAFALAGTDATKVADLLTGAANESQGTITDMGIALQQASAVARQAGVNLEDTVAFITLLAQAGIRGSDAGTSLRTAILRLISPTEQAAKIIRNLGIQTLDASGNLRPEVFAELQKALAGLETTARNQALRKIFGQDAIRAAVVFGREGVKGLNAVRDATQEAGLAAELAEARTKGFAGQVEALKNNAGTLGLVIGRLAIGPVGALVETLNQAALAAGDLVEALEKIPGAGAGGGGGKGFFGRAFDVAFTSGGDFLEDIRATAQALKDNPSSFFEDSGSSSLRVSKQVQSLNKKILETVETSSKLSDSFEGLAIPEDAIGVLEELRGDLVGTSEDTIAAEARIDSLINLIIQLGRVPTRIELAVLFNQEDVTRGMAALKHRLEKTNEGIINVQLKVAQDAARAIIETTKVTGENAVDVFIAQFAGKLTPEVWAQIMKDFFSSTPSTLQQLDQLATQSDNALFPEPAKGLTGKQILGRLAGFDAAEVRAEISGSTSQLIAVLQAELAFIENALKSEVAKKQPGIKRQLEAAQLSVINDLKSIANDRKRAADEAAEKIEQDNKDAAAAIVKSFGTAERNALNAQIRAEQTESLRDDITTSQALIRLYEQQKRVARKKIKDAETLADFLADANQKIFALEIDIAQDQKALRTQIRQEQRESRERFVEGIELDIELAEITENKQREIALRRKLIKALEDQIKHEKGNTNRIKELRNEIARQKKAIAEAQGEAEERSGAFRRLTFEFLQAQQGFASNLLGNLIPLGNVAGLVGNLQIGSGAGGGGGSSLGGPPAGFGPTLGIGRGPDGLPILTGAGGGAGGVSTAMATAGADGGPPPPTRGQSSTQIDLLRRIAKLLEDIKSGDMAPEAKKAKKLGGSTADVM